MFVLTPTIAHSVHMNLTDPPHHLQDTQAT